MLFDRFRCVKIVTSVRATSQVNRDLAKEAKYFGIQALVDLLEDKSHLFKRTSTYLGFASPAVLNGALNHLATGFGLHDWQARAQLSLGCLFIQSKLYVYGSSCVFMNDHAGCVCVSGFQKGVWCSVLNS